MTANLAALLYLVAGVLFILALRGLSSPATARKGNTYGIQLDRQCHQLWRRPVGA